MFRHRVVWKRTKFCVCGRSSARSSLSRNFPIGDVTHYNTSSKQKNNSSQHEPKRLDIDGMHTIHWVYYLYYYMVSLFDLRLPPLSCYVRWSVCVACWIVLWVCSVLCLYNRGRQAPGYFSWRISERLSLFPKVKRRSIPTRQFWWQVFS